MGQAVQGGMNTPPPMPTVQYFTAINGQQAGPFTIQQLQQLAGNGQLTRQTYIWKQGMANWDFAEKIPEVAALFVTLLLTTFVGEGVRDAMDPKSGDRYV